MKIYITILFISFSAVIYSQTAEMYLISSGGADFKTDNEQLTFTIGEIITETFSIDNLYLTQGFLQPITSVVGIKQKTNNNLGLSVYPNPTREYFYVDIENNSIISALNPYVLTIIEANGKVILNRKITKQKVRINTTVFCQGIYLIKIIDSSGKNQGVELLQIK